MHIKLKKGMTLVIILFVIFNIIKFKNNNNKHIVINGVKYSLNIDGASASSLPTTGYYYLTSYTCINGSVITWDAGNHDLYIEGINTNTEQCNLNFETKPSLNSMKVGDYVAYEGSNGCLKGVADTYTQSGNSCLGHNTKQASDTTGYTYGKSCRDGWAQFIVYGWRIAYIENDNVYLISAGSPECPVVSSSDDVLASTQVREINELALKYCNSQFVDGGTCSSSNTWAMGNDDFYKITYAISGTGSHTTSYFGTPNYSTTKTGYNNDLIENGGTYLLAARTSSSKVLYWNDSRNFSTISELGTNSINNMEYGMRPIIKLSSSVYITGGAGTMTNPYTIANTT